MALLRLLTVDSLSHKVSVGEPAEGSFLYRARLPPRLPPRLQLQLPAIHVPRRAPYSPGACTTVTPRVSRRDLPRWCVVQRQHALMFVASRYFQS